MDASLNPYFMVCVYVVDYEGLSLNGQVIHLMFSYGMGISKALMGTINYYSTCWVVAWLLKAHISKE